MTQNKPTTKQKEWEKELRLNLDDIFEDDHSYTRPSIYETFDRVLTYCKSFISQNFISKEELVKERDKWHKAGWEDFKKELKKEIENKKHKHKFLRDCNYNEALSDLLKLIKK